MPTENEWLRLIYTQLTAGGTAGASINQAQVKAAIESAVNIDGLELPIDAANSRMRTNDSWRARIVGFDSPELTSGASGFEFRWTVPPNREWKFQTAVAVYNTVSTVGNRTVQLSATNELGYVTELYTARSQLIQTATMTVKYCFSQHSLPTEIAGYRYNYFPAVVLSAGEELVLSCSNRQPADSFLPESAISVLSRNV